MSFKYILSAAILVSMAAPLSGCSVVRGTGRTVEAVGSGTGRAIQGVGAGVGEAVSGTGDAIEGAANDSDRRR